MSLFSELIAKRNSQKHLICHLQPLDPVGPSAVDIYLSTNGFTTLPSDTPANQIYKAKIRNGFDFHRSLYSEGKLSGRSIPGYGAPSFINLDAEFDSWKNLSWSAARLRFWLGGEGFTLADHGLVADVVADGVSFDQKEATVHVRDYQYLLDREIQATVFDGSGGNEGGPDVAGKKKPICCGVKANITPIYLGVDSVSGLHKFAIGDGRGSVGVLRVRDVGIPLDYVSSAPTQGGQWTVDLDAEVISLAFFDGPVTCDVIGWRYLSVASSTSWTVSNGSKTYSVTSTAGFAVNMMVRVARTSALGSTWGDGLITAIVANTSITVNVTSNSGAAGPFTNWTISPWGTIAGLAKAIATDLGIATFSTAKFTALDAAQPASIGHWIPDGGNGLQILDHIVGDNGGFYGFDRGASFEVGRVAPPASPVASYTGHDILENSLEHPQTLDPSHQTIVRYRHNETRMTADIAGIVGDDDRAFLTAEWRQEISDDPSVLVAYPSSQPIVVESGFYFQADAAAEAARLMAMFGVKRHYFQFDLKTQLLDRDVGDIINVSHSRMELSAGQNFILVDIHENLDPKRFSITAGIFG
jgi:hypothetical protein